MVAMVPMVLIIVIAPWHQYVSITVDGRQALVTMMIPSGYVKIAIENGDL